MSVFNNPHIALKSHMINGVAEAEEPVSGKQQLVAQSGLWPLHVVVGKKVITMDGQWKEGEEQKETSTSEDFYLKHWVNLSPLSYYLMLTSQWR